MDHIQHCAKIVLWRGIGFTALAIGTVVIGLSWKPSLALTTGAILTAIAALILFWKSLRAPSRDYRRTEVWLLLDKRHDLHEDRAQQVIGGMLGALYKQFAEYALMIAAGQWLLSIAARLV